MNPLLTLSGVELSRRIRTGELTSLEVVETHIDHVRRVNPVINAVVRERYEDARQEARAADRRTKETAPEDLPPFHGVPCSIKESISLRGMPNSSGLVARRSIVSEEDAPTVARLRRAGAIPIGVTNISELTMWMETNNRIYGRTNNPYDRRRIVGGSSGGEGAIVGAGGTPFGLGADVGGSIRMPAFFNGVFGHKPSAGLVPNTGQYPIAHGDALRYLCTGPITRRAEDLMPLVRVLAGPDGVDTACRPFEMGDPSTVRIDGLRVLNIVDNGRVRVSGDLRDGQRRVAGCLAAKGAAVEDVRIDAFRHTFEIWSAMMAVAGGPTFEQLLGEGRPVPLGTQLVRWSFRRSPHTLPAIILALLERFIAKRPKQVQKLCALGNSLREELHTRLGAQGVVLYPPYSRPAPAHYRPLATPFDFAYTALFNVMELPVTQVPLGLNAKGVPLGVQVAAAPGNDHLTIGVALELERAFGGWVPPPPLA